MTTKPLTDAEIAELERLEREATPGPWRECVWDPMERPHVHKDIPGEMVCGWKNDIPRTGADALLIALTRSALPSLLAEVRASRAGEPAPDAEAPRSEGGSTLPGAMRPEMVHARSVAVALQRIAAGEDAASVEADYGFPGGMLAAAAPPRSEAPPDAPAPTRMGGEVCGVCQGYGRVVTKDGPKDCPGEDCSHGRIRRPPVTLAVTVVGPPVWRPGPPQSPPPGACTCVIGPSSVVPSPSCPQHGHSLIPGRR